MRTKNILNCNLGSTHPVSFVTPDIKWFVPCESFARQYVTFRFDWSLTQKEYSLCVCEHHSDVVRYMWNGIKDFRVHCISEFYKQNKIPFEQGREIVQVMRAL